MAKKILLVEDEQIISEMYQTKLKSDGYDVLMADNGSDGLKMAISEKPDLVLLDIMLPLLDGFSVLEKMKANEAIAAIPVVMVTNLSTEEDRQKGERMGALDYLVKSNMTPEQLSQAIAKYLKA